MKIKRITINNFKGIEHVELDFDSGFNVIYGINGTGKSSVLDAISIGIGSILSTTGASFGLKGLKSRPLMKNEIRRVMVSDNNIELFDVTLSGLFKGENDIFEDENGIDWSRTQTINSKQLNTTNAKKLTEEGKKITQRLKEESSIPLFVNFSTARVWSQIYEKERTKKELKYEKTGSRLDGYYACLDPRSIEQKFLNWFKTYEDSILKFNKDKSLYVAFVNAITTMVPSWTDIKFNWALDDLVGKNDKDEWMTMGNLSDGYRGIASLAADIAYRAIKLNPHLGERAVLDTTGIVLIDELDMHLHPKWQKHVVNDLRKTFPNIQFIVTSHSPFILQSMKQNEVIHLDGDLITKDPIIMSIEEIAEDMDVENVRRSQLFIDYQKVAAEYFNALRQGENFIDSQQKALLKSKLDSYEQEFSDNPVYVALMKAERESQSL